MAKKEYGELNFDKIFEKFEQMADKIAKSGENVESVAENAGEHVGESFADGIEHGLEDAASRIVASSFKINKAFKDLAKKITNQKNTFNISIGSEDIAVDIDFSDINIDSEDLRKKIDEAFEGIKIDSGIEFDSKEAEKQFKNILGLHTKYATKLSKLQTQATNLTNPDSIKENAKQQIAIINGLREIQMIVNDISDNSVSLPHVRFGDVKELRTKIDLIDKIKAGEDKIGKQRDTNNKKLQEENKKLKERNSLYEEKYGILQDESESGSKKTRTKKSDQSTASTVNHTDDNINGHVLNQLKKDAEAASKAFADAHQNLLRIREAEKKLDAQLQERHFVDYAKKYQDALELRGQTLDNLPRNLAKKKDHQSNVQTIENIIQSLIDNGALGALGEYSTPKDLYKFKEYKLAVNVGSPNKTLNDMLNSLINSLIREVNETISTYKAWSNNQSRDNPEADVLLEERRTLAKEHEAATKAYNDTADARALAVKRYDEAVLKATNSAADYSEQHTTNTEVIIQENKAIEEQNRLLEENAKLSKSTYDSPAREKPAEMGKWKKAKFYRYIKGENGPEQVLTDGRTDGNYYYHRNEATNRWTITDSVSGMAIKDGYSSYKNAQEDVYSDEMQERLSKLRYDAEHLKPAIEAMQKAQVQLNTAKAQEPASADSEEQKRLAEEAAAAEKARLEEEARLREEARRAEELRRAEAERAAKEQEEAERRAAELAKQRAEEEARITAEKEKQLAAEMHYYPINEGAAKRAKEANSYNEYVPGSATAEYRRQIDAARKLVEEQKARVDVMYHEKIDQLFDTYARKLAENMNESFEIDARMPSILISGGGNFDVGKKQKQNAARDKNMEEWRSIQELLHKIRATGTGGISADDERAVEKLEAKLKSLIEYQQLMKDVNAYYRKHGNLDGFEGLTDDVKSQLMANMSSDWHLDKSRVFPAFKLQNNSAEIRRLQERIEQLKKHQTQEYPEWEFEGGQVKVNKEANRIQIFFDGKPAEDVRDQMKANAFKWSPKESAWQRQLNDNAYRAMDNIDAIQPGTGEKPYDMLRKARTEQKRMAEEAAEMAKQRAEEEAFNAELEEAVAAEMEAELKAEQEEINLAKEELKIEQEITKEQEKQYGYHAGKFRDDGFRAESLWQSTPGRGTGFYGTGTYMTDAAHLHEITTGQYGQRPLSVIDPDMYNLFDATNDKTADRLHQFLKGITKKAFNSKGANVKTLYAQFKELFPKDQVITYEDFKSLIGELQAYVKENHADYSKSKYMDSVSTKFMKHFGYEGVDTRGTTRHADTEYGTVVYNLKEESIVLKEITNEMQKQEIVAGNIASVIEQQNKASERGAEIEASVENTRKHKVLRGVSSKPGKYRMKKSEAPTVDNVIPESVEASTPKVESEADALDKVGEAAEKAAGKKKKFAQANKEVAASVVPSVEGLEAETEAFEDAGAAASNAEFMTRKGIRSISLNEIDDDSKDSIDKFNLPHAYAGEQGQDAVQMFSKLKDDIEAMTGNPVTIDFISAKNAAGQLEAIGATLKYINEETGVTVSQTYEIQRNEDGVLVAIQTREKATLNAAKAAKVFNSELEQQYALEQIKTLESRMGTLTDSTGEFTTALKEAREAAMQIDGKEGLDNFKLKLKMAQEKSKQLKSDLKGQNTLDTIASMEHRLLILPNQIKKMESELNGLGDVEGVEKIARDIEDVNNKYAEFLEEKDANKKVKLFRDITSSMILINSNLSTIKYETAQAKKEQNKLNSEYAEYVKLIEKRDAIEAKMIGLDPVKNRDELAALQADYQAVDDEFNSKYGDFLSRKDVQEHFTIDELAYADDAARRKMAIKEGKISDKQRLEEEAAAQREVNEAYNEYVYLIQERGRAGVRLAGLDPEKNKEQINELTAYIDEIDVKLNETYGGLLSNHIAQATLSLEDFTKYYDKWQQKLAEKEAQAADKARNKEEKPYRDYGKTTANAAKTKQARLQGAVESLGVIDKKALAQIDNYNAKVKEVVDLREQFESDPKAAQDATLVKNFQKASHEADQLYKNIKAVVDEEQKMIQMSMEQGFNPIELSAAQINNLENEMIAHAKATAQGRVEIKGWNDDHTKMYYTVTDSKGAVHEMTESFGQYTHNLTQVRTATKETGTLMQQIFKGVKVKAKELISYVIGGGSVYKVISMLRQGIQYVREIDLALTELKKVTDETEETYDKFLKTAAKTAEKVGSTIKDVVSSTADWARLGYSMEQAAKFAETTQILMNVSEFTDVSQATDTLISAVQAFGYTADTSMEVVDMLNTIGNNYAISTADLAQSLTKSSASLVAAGGDLAEAAALTATANKIIQDADSVGTALKTTSLRLRGTEVSVLEQEGLDSEGAVSSKSKLQSKVKALSGVDILTATGEYKSTYEILRDIADVWESMNDMDQAECCLNVQKCA